MLQNIKKLLILFLSKLDFFNKKLNSINEKMLSLFCQKSSHVDCIKFLSKTFFKFRSE